MVQISIYNSTPNKPISLSQQLSITATPRLHFFNLRPLSLFFLSFCSCSSHFFLRLLVNTILPFGFPYQSPSLPHFFPFQISPPLRFALIQIFYISSPNQLRNAYTLSTREKERDSSQLEMAREMQKNSMFIEHGPEAFDNGGIRKNIDDDGREKRTGNELFYI